MRVGGRDGDTDLARLQFAETVLHRDQDAGKLRLRLVGDPGELLTRHRLVRRVLEAVDGTSVGVIADGAQEEHRGAVTW